ncbi:hypothetical protein M9Y10_011396 [Tritrichomonas musculus]|uniref:Uncharacterized protein n=1 Tax=Tritrichomonas musculus TaxID=1915356 RepID=A0ABR2IKF7_9EUKA
MAILFSDDFDGNKQYIDSLIKELKECKYNQKCEQLLQDIDLLQRLVQSSYDEFLFSANESYERSFRPEEHSSEVFTDDQLKQLREDHDSDAVMF